MNQTVCIFCEIAKGKSKAHIIWEDKTHLAFLSIFPNTEGFTVVIPKKHQTSYLFDQSEKVISDLALATQKVAKKIDSAFVDVGRTGLIFEGFGVDHLHAKLFPMHGTSSKTWQKRASKINKYFKKYEGYISSHNHLRADDKKLKKTAAKIKKA